MSEQEEKQGDEPEVIDWLPVAELSNVDVLMLAARRFELLELYHAKHENLHDSAEAGRIAQRLKRIAAGVNDARVAMDRLGRGGRAMLRELNPAVVEAMEAILTRGETPHAGSDIQGR